MNEIQQIRKTHTVAELQKMFVNRTNDELFAEVGVENMTTGELKRSEAHHCIWRGYERLVGSKFLPF